MVRGRPRTNPRALRPMIVRILVRILLMATGLPFGFICHKMHLAASKLKKKEAQ